MGAIRGLMAAAVVAALCVFPGGPLLGARDDGKSVVVMASGSAPVMGGDVKRARETAVQAALRAAVEEGVGMYITSRTRVENMAMIQDIIVKQSGGLAVIKRIVREGAEKDVYRVQAEIAVSALSIIDVLRQNGLLRVWRVMVVIPEFHIQRPIVDPAAETEFLRQFAAVGFKTMDQTAYRELRDKTPHYFKDNARAATFARGKGADILITGEAFSERSMDATGSLMRGLVACNARVEVRAIAVDTGEVIYADAHTTPVPLLHTSESVAAKRALQSAAEELAKKFVMVLVQRPAALTRPTVIEAGPFPGVQQATAFERDIRKLRGVKKVHREQFDRGSLVLEAEVASDESDAFAAEIERRVSVPGHSLVVEGAARNVVRIRLMKK
ncbi:MAG TPA: hypothetical protein PLE73_00905 [Spirochaetota bacterium]|nr:hypothetical protein [Spirochaetota bacterium]HOS40254.1 hypothetical protein [Spirochaetota bacterium]HPI21725.1 hypothetical protein [Spirochaetota bacterium]HPU86825.1 hypothetical protein [Spirochaetota bacterium]